MVRQHVLADIGRPTFDWAANVRESANVLKGIPQNGPVSFKLVFTPPLKRVLKDVRDIVVGYRLELQVNR